LLLAPYAKKDFKSHDVSKAVYEGTGDMRVSSKKMCRLLAGLHKWNVIYSYRIPGEYIADQNVVAFDLKQAAPIPYDGNVHGGKRNNVNETNPAEG
jgi:hypothetical protein